MASFNEKVREILDGLENDDDFVREVRNKIDFTEAIDEAMQDDGVKRAVKKAIISALKAWLEDDESTSIQDVVSEQVDLGNLVKEALQDEEIQTSLRKAVTGELKRAIDDNDDWVSDAIAEALHEEVDIKAIFRESMSKDEGLRAKLNEHVIAAFKSAIEEYELDSDDISESVDFTAQAKALIQTNDPQIIGAISQLILDDIKGWNELTEEESEKIHAGLGISDLLQRLLENPEFKQLLDEKLRESVKDEINNLGQSQSDEIARSILDSPMFKTTIERVISDAGSSGKVEEFAKAVVERTLRENRRFHETVLEQVQQALAARLASGLVKSAFGADAHT